MSELDKKRLLLQESPIPFVDVDALLVYLTLPLDVSLEASTQALVNIFNKELDSSAVWQCIYKNHLDMLLRHLREHLLTKEIFLKDQVPIVRQQFIDRLRAHAYQHQGPSKGKLRADCLLAEINPLFEHLFQQDILDLTHVMLHKTGLLGQH